MLTSIIAPAAAILAGLAFRATASPVDVKLASRQQNGAGTFTIKLIEFTKDVSAKVSVSDSVGPGQQSICDYNSANLQGIQVMPLVECETGSWTITAYRNIESDPNQLVIQHAVNYTTTHETIDQSIDPVDLSSITREGIQVEVFESRLIDGNGSVHDFVEGSPAPKPEGGAQPGATPGPMP